MIPLTPFTTQEAVLSSRIEGTQATLTEVSRFEAGEPLKQEARRRDNREILSYEAALRYTCGALAKRQPPPALAFSRLPDLVERRP